MHSMAVVGFLSRLEKMSKDFDVILDRHGDKPNNPTAIPINWSHQTSQAFHFGPHEACGQGSQHGRVLDSASVL